MKKVIDKDKLVKVGIRVRGWAEGHWKCKDSSLYCWCGICSFRLFRLLRGYGSFFVCVIDPWDNSICHCFVLCGDYLVDVTATQFGESRRVVVIRQRSEDCFRWYWNWENNCCFRSRDIRLIRNFFKDWPCDQNPFKLRRE